MIKQQISVSIIMPIFNAARYLERSIQSVLQQTFSEWELLLIDDGSTDDSLSICQQYAGTDARIRVMSQTNRGVSATRNVGMLNALGTYVMFIDADDQYHTTIVETVLAAQQNGHLDLCVCGIANHPFSSKAISRSKEPIVCDIFRGRDLERALNRLLTKSLFNNIYNKIYRRHIIQSYNIQMDEKCEMGEDLLFNIDYLTHCQSLGVIDKKLYYYGVNLGSLQFKTRKDNFERRMQQLDRLLDLYKKKNFCLNQVYLEYLKQINLSLTELDLKGEVPAIKHIISSHWCKEMLMGINQQKLKYRWFAKIIATHNLRLIQAVLYVSQWRQKIRSPYYSKQVAR